MVGRSYQVERSQDLSSWDPMGAAVSGDGNVATVVDDDAPAGSAFYRVVVDLE